LEGFDRAGVAAPIAFVAMAHVDPIRDHEGIIGFAIGAEDAGVNVVDFVAEMVVEIFEEVVIPIDGARIVNGEVVGFFAVFEAAHEGAFDGALVAEPDGREVDPIVDDVFEAGLVEALFHGVVLLPEPLAGRAFDGAPGDVVFVGDEAEVFEMDLGFEGGRGLEIVGFGECADGRALDVGDGEVTAGEIPGMAVEGRIGLGDTWNWGNNKEKRGKAKREGFHFLGNRSQSGVTSTR